MDNKGKPGLISNEQINSVTEVIIGSAIRVCNVLGAGFLEKVYENALAHELRKRNVRVAQQVQISVMYDGVNVGDYCADLIAEGIVIIELKVVEKIDPIHYAQCLNYLHATNLPACLLLNFKRPKLEYRRILNTPYSLTADYVPRTNADGHG